MGRFWSLLFLMVPIFGVGAFVCGIADGPAWLGFNGHWLPENISARRGVIDDLFMFILYLTGVIFVATGIALFWFLWKYDATRNPEPVKYTHGSHTLEVVWSILPAATLLFIAIFQMNAWTNAKIVRPTISEHGREVPVPPIAEVTGRQFEWRLRYPGKDNQFNTLDDLLTVNDLHLPVDEQIVLAIKSQDVLHSFFLPHLRVKQDVVPGMTQFVWFTATRTGQFDIVCAELCGWGHYKMKGRLTIQSRAEFDRWLEEQYEAQEVSQFSPNTGEESDE